MSVSEDSLGSTTSSVNNGDGRNTPTKAVRLKKEIGLFEGVGVIVGAIIGSGLFISPKGITEAVYSVGLSLVVWTLSGIISTIGALCYAELGTAYPTSGADYHYLYAIFGPMSAFLYLWATVMIFIPVNYAVLALVCAQYMIQPFFPSDCSPPELSIRLLAAVLICFLIWLNSFDVKITAQLQNVFTVAKIGALVAIVVTGMIAIARGRTENFENMFRGSNYDPGSIAIAFYSGIYAFGGANSLNYMTEELKNPNRNLPWAIYISLAIVTVISILVNIAYFSVISPDLMIASDATAVAFAEVLLGSWKWVIPVFVAISTFGGLSVGLMISSRILFVGARNGHFPQMLALIKLPRLTPAPSLMCICVLSLVYLFVSDVYTLINYGGFIYSISTAAVIAGLVFSRWREPLRPRPIKMHLALPIIYFVISLFLFLLPIYVAPWEAVIGCALVLSGIPVYWVAIRPTKLPRFLVNFNVTATIFVQKLVLAVPEEGQDME